MPTCSETTHEAFSHLALALLAAGAVVLALGLNHPRPEDRARAARAGVNPGGDIFIHGQPPGIPQGRRLGHDWTAGGIALSNAEMDELWRVVPLGPPVDIPL